MRRADIYMPSSLETKRYDPDLPINLRGILSLAGKYQIDSIRSLIVKHLEADWPTDLLGWYKLKAELKSQHDFRHGCDDGNGIPAERHFPEPASAIRLAIDFDIPSILPAAFYRLAISDVSISWPELGPDSDEGQLSARWDLLHGSDWRCLVRGKKRLLEIFRDDIDTFIDLSDECRQLEKCSKAETEVSTICGRRCDTLFALQPDVLAELWRLIDGVDLVRFCYRCSNHIRSGLRELSDETWTDLPKTFELQQ